MKTLNLAQHFQINSRINEWLLVMLIILRLTVLPHKHPHELLDSIVKERWLILSSQPRRAFYSSLMFRQAFFQTDSLRNPFYSTACASDLLQASRQREANNTAFKTAVNHLITAFDLLDQITNKASTTASLARRILHSFRCTATPLFKLTSCFTRGLPRGLRQKRCGL